MRNKQGRLLGVAAFDLTLRYSKEVMIEEKRAGLTATHLIDDQANVVISSESDLRGKPLQIDGLQTAIAESRVGQFEISRTGKPMIITYAKIETLDWFLIQEVDIATY